MNGIGRVPVLAGRIFIAALAAATLPVWRMALSGVSLTTDDLLSIRCLTW